jgi:ABC-type dipeptide/oligopeptide/nickel transport system permease component
MGDNAVTHLTLAKIIRAAKAGRRQAARASLARLVQSTPGNVHAWLWLAALVDDIEHKRYCLNQVQRIEPDHPTATQAMGALRRQTTFPPSFPPNRGQKKLPARDRIGRKASLPIPPNRGEEKLPARGSIEARAALPIPPGKEKEGRWAQGSAEGKALPSISTSREGEQPAQSSAGAGSRAVLDALVFVGQRLAFGLLVLVSIAYLGYLGLDMAGGVPFGSAAGQALVRTVTYAGRLARGDLGMTLAGSDTALPRPVGVVILERLPRSLGLLGVSLALAGVVGIVLGVLAARGRSQRSLAILLSTLVGISVPSFFAAFLLQWALISLTRQTGRSLMPVGGFGWDKHLILPVIVLAARPIAQITRIAFLSVREVLAQDYVRTAHSKGLRRQRVMAVHVMRNAAIPILTTIAVSLRFSMSSLPLVELYFGWPGAGFTLLKGISQREDNLTVALLLCLGVFIIAVNLLLDLSYRFIDPRLWETPAHVAARERQTLRESLASAWDVLHGLIADNALARWLRRRRSKGLESPLSTIAARRPVAVDERPAASGHGGRSVWVAMSRNAPLIVGALLVLGLGIVVLAGPQLAPNNPAHMQSLIQQDGKFFSPPFAPGERYPWGTDAIGRGILSMVLAGARQTLILAVLAVAARAAVGVLLGAIAGWTHGSVVDRAILGAAEVIASFPTLLLAMTLILALGIRRGMPPFIIALCFAGWGEIMQYVRGQVIAIRPQPYIESAVAIGARTPRILGRHILPHLFAALTSILALEMGAVLMLLGELGFISIFIGGGTVHARIPGVRVLYSDVPEWGAMLSSQRLLARSYPWTAFYPMLAFTLSILAFNLFGEGVRRLLEGGKLIVNRLVNRYTVSLAATAAVLVVWLSTNSGVMPFYQQQAGTFDGGRAMEHVVALTDPAMEGRALGSAGMDRAAEYLAGQFKALGLQPGGQEGSYFQERNRSFERLEEIPVFAIEDGGDALVYRRDFSVYSGLYVSAGEAAGPVRFVGLGRAMDVTPGVWRPTYAELERADFGGEILLTLSTREAEELNRVRKDALLIVADESIDLARQYTLGSRPRGSYFPWLWVTEQTAERLLAGSGYTLQAIRDKYTEIPAEGVFQAPLQTEAHVQVAGTVEGRWPVRHVIGYIPGAHGYDFCADCLGKQLILVMVPYDSPPPDPAAGVVPAVNDNASGVAVMLEAIRLIRETDYQPYKTIMFIAYSEEGLEGGEYVYEPDVSRFFKARRALSNLELEAVVRLRGVGGGAGDRLEIAAGGSQRLAKLFAEAARRMDVRCARAKETMDISVVYRDSDASSQSGTDVPSVRLFWQGWEETSRTAEDTLENVSAENLEQAGRTLALALMVLGRETEY